MGVAGDRESRITPRAEEGAAGPPVPLAGLLVTGTPRSGTTWVGRLLAMQPGLCYVHEPMNGEARLVFHRVLGPPLEPYFRHVRPGSDFPEAGDFLDYILGRSDRLERSDRSSWSPEERRLFRAFHRDRGRGAAPVIKDPTAVLAMEWIHDRYGIPVIAMVRHPGEFARSMIRLGWTCDPSQYWNQPELVETLPAELVRVVEGVLDSGDRVRQAAAMWAVLTHHVREVAQRQPGVRLVKHEELALSPVAGFAELAAWLGLHPDAVARLVEPYCAPGNPVEPERHDDFRRDSRANTGRWFRYFGEAEKRAIQDVVEPLSDLLGYSFDDPEQTGGETYVGQGTGGATWAPMGVAGGEIRPDAAIRAGAAGGAHAAEGTRPSARRKGGEGRRPAIVILGMHRSGTSALAQLVHRLGAQAPRTLMSPGPDNPSGFWESERLVGLADEILAEHGMAWDSLGSVAAGWFRTPAGRPWVERYAAALLEEYPGEAPLFVKDPRLCRMVPLLREVCRELALAPHFVLTLRHPLEVVGSLRTRNGCSAERALALWLEHSVISERATRGTPRTLVTYDRLLRDWRGVAAEVGRTVTLLTPDANLAATLDAEITPDRRHHVAPDGPGSEGGPLLALAEECHRALLGLEREGDPRALEVLDRIRRRLRGAERLVVPIARDLERALRKERRDRERVQAHLGHAEGLLDDLRAQVADRAALEQWNQEMETALVAVERELERARERLDLEREEREAVQVHLDFAERALGEARERMAELEWLEEEQRALQARYEEALAGHDERVGELTEAHRAEVDSLRREIEAGHAALAAAMNSRSMRLTRPMRDLFRVASRVRSGVGERLWSVARRAYWAAPVPEPARAVVTETLARHRQQAAVALVEQGRRSSLAAPMAAAATGDLKEQVRRATERELEEFLALGARLELPAPGAAPGVTVVLVLYNQAPLTFACLRALAESTYRDFEVVIVDNASTDRTGELLERVGPCRVIRNEENRHFLRGCNQAAEHARGRYLLLLNNDTRVGVDAIGRAVQVFEEEEGVGAVGARLILPDGTLQEAGSIVWSDGSCLGYGRGEDPLDPRFAFRRDVDYCSAAFLLTDREVFDRLGRFDEALAPAYYEETDYCLRLWGAGYRVVYEPGVVVRHFEFGSSSHSGAAEQSRRNQERFRAKHSARLRGHLPPNPRNVLRASSARRDAPRLLVIEDRFPHGHLGSGFPRANHLLWEMAAAGCEITLYATNQSSEPWEVVYSDLPRRAEFLRGDRKRELAEILRSRQGTIDTVFVSRPHNMEALNRVVAADPKVLAGARIVYDAEALFALRDLARAEMRGKKLDEQARARQVEAEVELARPADVVLAVSELEAEHFRRALGREVLVLGHCLERRTSPGYGERNDFLFVGAFHDDGDPNSDSMIWFVREVWPLVQRDPRMPIGVQLRIVGKDPGPRVRNLGRRPGVEVTGRVDSTEPFYDRSRVCVVPTRYAAGVPYKAHEAAAAGIPLVSTDLIARQLGWSHEAELLVASRDSAAEFAEQCVRLYVEEELWERVREGAWLRIDRECTPAATRGVLRRALGLEGASAPAPGPGGAGVATIPRGPHFDHAAVAVTAARTAAADPIQ